MERVIMPELISPVFAEMISENPELLKIIVDHQSGEELIVGQNCTLDCNCNPTNVKLVFCNVTIGIDDTVDECDNTCGSGETEEQIGNCHIKINDGALGKRGFHWEELLNELSQLKLEVAVLEARMEEAKKILKLIPRQACNRKLVARCKIDINEALEHLADKKRELGYKAWLMEN
ncbi:MAG TPA: hypothetical protein VEB00_05075 [Clostridia bacterium]|nr:hypothetical protein [Clostridia bacterium]